MVHDDYKFLYLLGGTTAGQIIYRDIQQFGEEGVLVQVH